jgi:hypothetical protein
LVLLFADDLQDLDEIHYQTSVLVLGDEAQCHLLEGLGRLGVKLGCVEVPLLLEKLIRVDSRNIGLLAVLTVLEGLLDVPFLKVLLPSVSVLVLEGSVLDLVLGANYQNIALENIVNRGFECKRVK